MFLWVPLLCRQKTTPEYSASLQRLLDNLDCIKLRLKRSDTSYVLLPGLNHPCQHDEIDLTFQPDKTAIKYYPDSNNHDGVMTTHQIMMRGVRTISPQWKIASFDRDHSHKNHDPWNQSARSWETQIWSILWCIFYSYILKHKQPQIYKSENECLFSYMYREYS